MVFMRVLYMFGNQTETYFLATRLNFDKKWGKNLTFSGAKKEKLQRVTEQVESHNLQQHETAIAVLSKERGE